MNQGDFKANNVIFLAILLASMWPKDLNAYIDPGTTSIAFSALGYIFSLALLGITFFIRPLRSLIKSVFAKLLRREKAGEKKGV